MQGGIERLDLRPGIEGDDVEQVEWPAVEARPGGAGAVGDALHLLEVFLVVAAQEQGIDQGARRLPAVGRRLGTLHGGETADVRRRSPGQQPAMLHAAFIRLALDVQDDPAGLRIAIGRAVTLHRMRVRREIACRRGAD